ncbi:hypothetical protein V2I78_19395 [Pseudomonas viridiflava]|uniref:hypothetical protein n=1 Tax=Pseudomonas viridiflava TaxID=33069 RepID=UPI002EC732FE|nr:hypothetical protein [Pseudomonas viridiflava]
MYGVINFDILLAPALGRIEDSERLALGLSALSEHLATANPPLYLEQNIMEKMIDAEVYPSEGMYKHRISQIPNFPIDAKDLVRMVNTIIQRGVCASAIEPKVEVEWGEKSLLPTFQAMDARRNADVESLYEEIAKSSYFNGEVYSVLYYCLRGLNLINKVSFNGVANDIFPEANSKLPFLITKDINVFCDYFDFLRSCDGVSLFNNASNEAQLKLAFFVGALRLAEECGNKDLAYKWEDFSLGGQFIRSLNDNESGPGMRYGSVVYEAVVHILAFRPKSEINIFTKTAVGSEARIDGNFTAHRTHLTSSGRGLRLMFWRDEEGVIEFSNVGNKSELKIEALD